jgi:hypothetical protein
VDVAKALLLWDASAGIRIGSTEAARLAELGVTSVTLLCDADTVAVALDGWAFSPARSAWAAAAVLGDDSTCRVLQPALDVSVSNAGMTGGFDEEAVARSGGDAGGGGTAVG